MEIKVKCAKCGKTITMIVNNLPKGMTIQDIKNGYHLCDKCDGVSW